MKLSKPFFIIVASCSITLAPLKSMTEEPKKAAGESKQVASQTVCPSGQIVLPKTCAWAIKAQPAQAHAIRLWCQSISKILIGAKDNPVDLYKGLEDIFIAVGQVAQRDHYVTPEFVAQCIIELDINITQLIYVKTSYGAGGYSMLKLAMYEKHQEIIETLSLVLADPKNFLPGRLLGGRSIKFGDPNS